ncbi:MAG TPA: hypothetical protein PK668_22950 [Myxococcota bacterium]|nr:hypothetical protein [Myxococcota bacterium]HRY95554.1 hypothetical protein [Myxococcota bacterium]HSA22744.1 hypothetical protein [Myxococcota bacterium]
MWDYVRLHESFVRAALEGQHGTFAQGDWAALLGFHQEQIARMQHERFIHLTVTMFVATFLLLSLGFALVHPTWPGLALTAVLLGLTGAYLVHYFRLENGVQRWYHLANRLSERAGRLGASYEGAAIRPWGLPQR